MPWEMGVPEMGCLRRFEGDQESEARKAGTHKPVQRLGLEYVQADAEERDESSGIDDRESRNALYAMQRA